MTSDALRWLSAVTVVSGTWAASAMPERVSPRCTTYACVTGGRGAVVGLTVTPGRSSFCPAMITASGPSLLARTMAATVMWNRSAIPLTVSPGRTTCTAGGTWGFGRGADGTLGRWAPAGRASTWPGRIRASASRSFAASRASTVVPVPAAIAQIVSPGFTVYVTARGVGAGAR